MNKVIITVGCSGSGKTTFCNKNYSSYEHICMDDIRKLLTGNISDQSRNEEVYKLYVDKLIDAVHNGRDICLVNTNLGTSKIFKEIAKVLSNKSEVTILFFEDSKNWELCLSRVSEDIMNGVDRSNTTGNRESGVPIIKEMSERYIKMREIPEKDILERFKRCKSVEIKYI